MQKLHQKFWWLCVCAYKVIARVLVALHLLRPGLNGSELPKMSLE